MVPSIKQHIWENQQLDSSHQHHNITIHPDRNMNVFLKKEAKTSKCQGITKASRNFSEGKSHASVPAVVLGGSRSVF